MKLVAVDYREPPGSFTRHNAAGDTTGAIAGMGGGDSGGKRECPIGIGIGLAGSGAAGVRALAGARKIKL